MWPIPVLLVLVVACLALATSEALESRRLEEHGHIAPAEVVEIDDSASGSGVPTVEFATEHGSTRVRLANPLGRGYRTGQILQVRFDPRMPEGARQDDVQGLWASVVIATGIGLAMIAATVVYSVLRRQSMRA